MVTPYTIFMAIKGLSIEQFKRNVIARSGGISASNLYQFAIQSPELPGEAGYSLDKHFKRNLENATGLTKGETVNYQLNMLCNEIQVPGVTMSASDVKMPQKGMIQKLANAKVYNELDVSFYCDADSIPFKFFRCWQDYIIGAVDKPREMYSADHTLSKYRHRAYAQRYYDHYTCDIAIAKLEKYGVKPPEESEEPDEYKLSFISKLVKAYPYTVSSIPYSAGPAQLVKVTVGFYYEYSHLIT
tara:strand:- start:1390 stop:2118 length:729 start_codon:yes stop_codon:yes gene_type:complete